MNSVDNYGWESSLSMVANEQTRTARHRHGVTLLRPVFMNAVEVGYSYAHCDRDKKLNVRGVTIALWHFICRGHQAIALLPYCFKNYAEKSSRYSELMMLYRLNLIEFTPGYGSEKYAEVNRIMVNRAYETGGCLVARSQMQGITDNKTNLIDVVEQRLLMPTFNGDDIMFPIDGPLGRNGPSLKQTLECEQGSSDWRSCSEHQLLLSDQRHWLEKLALLVPEKVAWTRMVQVIQAGGETSPSSGNLTGFDPLLGLDPPLPPSPPISTPNAVVDNPFQRSTTTNNVAIEQQHNSSYQQVNPSPPSTTPNVQFYDPNPYHPNNLQQPHYHLPNPHQLHRYRHQQMSPPPRRYYSNSHHHSQQHNGNGNGNGNSNSNNNNSNNNNNNNHNHYQHHHHRQHSTTRLILRYGPNGGQDARTSTSGGVYRRPTSRHSADSLDSASTQSGGSGVAASATTTTTTTGGAEIDENVARLLNAELVEEERREMEKRRKVEATQRKRDETLAKLSQIFGYSKSVRVMEKFPTISTYCLLVEKCLQEADQEGDGCEFDDVWKNAKQNDQNDLQVVVEDLVSIVTSGATDAQGQSDAHIQNLIDFSDELVVLDATTDNDDDSNHYGDELRQQQQQQINSMVDNSPPQPLQTRLDFFA